ncbi:MAG: S8 family serine peptidase [Lachnospiraceae bacterium]|nr:S8 family serine peptidase [Lachnospiraceae bacterium]
MNRSVKIAIIDNGVDGYYINGDLEASFVIDKNGVCKEDYSSIEEQYFKHGTVCAYIIKNNAENSKLYSVRMLDENGRGLVRSLSPALEWCYQNSIRLVNLSLGTAHFRDKAKIRKCINHYVHKGMIIVAATSNRGYMTYPASFSNVIGVEMGEDFCFAELSQKQKGVDFIAPVKLEHLIEKVPLGIPRSNSYAAPYVTAMIANILQENPSANLTTIRKTICNSQKENTFFYAPDWMETAWVSEKCQKSEATYYFKHVAGDLDACKDEIDTLVVVEKEELQKYYSKEKHIVYLGEDSVECLSMTGYFWSKKLRIEQITSSPKRISEIEIPIIIIKLCAGYDPILLLDVLRNCFSKEGHNIYAVSNEIESVLYDLEFLPKELCSPSNSETVLDFLYWQIFYNQSDAVLYCTDKEEYLSFIENADMVVKINPDGEKNTAEIYCDGAWRKNVIFTCMNRQDIISLFQCILKLLTEGNNGQ